MSDEQARAFAVVAHGDQRYGQHPYVKHLDDVAAVCRYYFVCCDELVEIAYLHDVLEDTDVGVDQLSDQFGVLVTDACLVLRDEPGANRRDRKRRTHAKLAMSTNRWALKVKAADRLANVRACLEHDPDGLLDMYRGEHAEFRKAVYREGMCEMLWVELDGLLGGIVPEGKR